LKSRSSNDVVVLGAGFSLAVSGRFPLTDALGNQAVDIAGIQMAEPFEGGRFEAWLSKLAEPQPYLSPAENTENFAKFQRLIEALHQILCEAEAAAVADGLPDWVVRFVTALHFRRATVVTFNYDRLVERAMELAEIDDFEKLLGEERVSWLNMLRDVPSFPPIGARFGETTTKPAIQLLKLHGSLNWFWVSGDGSGATLSHWELDDDTERRQRYLPGREPFVVPPAAGKSAFFRNPIMSDIWRRSAAALRVAKRVALVGYSLPLTDLVSASMMSETLSRTDVEIEVVNPYPNSVIDSVHRLTGLRPTSTASVVDFVNRYVESASRHLGEQCREEGIGAPDGSLLLVGWNKEFFARVTGINRVDDGLELMVDDFHLAVPTALQQPAALGLDPVPFADLVRVLRHDDLVVAVFANGSRATLVGIDRYRTETGLATDWQVLIPADSPASLGLTSWKDRQTPSPG
jgi:hypothetical protein